jgi:hypothetical protein
VTAFTWALAALTANVAEAAPVPLAGQISFTVATDCSPWCGSAEAKADVLGVEGKLANGQFQGGGGAATSAILGGGGFLGKTAAATASFKWMARVEAAPGADPLHLFFDWNATLFASHDALLGQATGGIEFDVTLYKCLSVYPLPGCFPFPTF